MVISQTGIGYGEWQNEFFNSDKTTWLVYKEPYLKET